MPPGAPADLLAALSGGGPDDGGLPPAPGEPDMEAEKKPDDDMAITRGQADFVMDIVERTLASQGKGSTKDQREAESEFELKAKEEGMKNKASEAAAGVAAPTDPAAAPGPVTGLPGMSPAAFQAPRQVKIASALRALKIR